PMRLLTKLVTVFALLALPFFRVQADEYSPVEMLLLEGNEDTLSNSNTCIEPDFKDVKFWGAAARCSATGYGNPVRTQMYYPGFILDTRLMKTETVAGQQRLTLEAYKHQGDYTRNTLNLIDQVASDIYEAQLVKENEARNGQAPDPDEKKFWIKAVET